MSIAYTAAYELVAECTRVSGTLLTANINCSRKIMHPGDMNAQSYRYMLQVRTDGSAHCCYSVGTGLSTRQPAMPTPTVPKVSTSFTTRDDDGFPPPWPTSWTCSWTTNGPSKSMTTFHFFILCTRYVVGSGRIPIFIRVQILSNKMLLEYRINS
jgi:hypothetical protein